MDRYLEHTTSNPNVLRSPKTGEHYTFEYMTLAMESKSRETLTENMDETEK